MLLRSVERILDRFGRSTGTGTRLLEVAATAPFLALDPLRSHDLASLNGHGDGALLARHGGLGCCGCGRGSSGTLDTLVSLSHEYASIDCFTFFDVIPSIELCTLENSGRGGGGDSGFGRGGSGTLDTLVSSLHKYASIGCFTFFDVIPSTELCTLENSGRGGGGGLRWATVLSFAGLTAKVALLLGLVKVLTNLTTGLELRGALTLHLIFARFATLVVIEFGKLQLASGRGFGERTRGARLDGGAGRGGLGRATVSSICASTAELSVSRSLEKVLGNEARILVGATAHELGIRALVTPLSSLLPGVHPLTTLNFLILNRAVRARLHGGSHSGFGYKLTMLTKLHTTLRRNF